MVVSNISIYFLFSPPVGEMIQFEYYSNRLKPPTRSIWSHGQSETSKQKSAIIWPRIGKSEVPISRLRDRNIPTSRDSIGPKARYWLVGLYTIYIHNSTFGRGWKKNTQIPPPPGAIWVNNWPQIVTFPWKANDLAPQPGLCLGPP